MPRLGVIGWPVDHSRSPAMFTAAFAELGLSEWRYQRLPVPPELFEQTTRSLSTAGFAGANVTIPHKHAALELADQASQAALQIGAANTLTFLPDGAIHATNTDAPGLIAALAQLTNMSAHPSAMVLGAGGSARAAVWALRQAGASEISLHNRTYERALKLAREFDISAVRTPVPADLLINCTSVGLELSATESQALNQLALTFDAVGKYSYVVDFVYSTSETALLTAARRCGAATLDGLELLLAQGALSFEHWIGQKAPIEAMRRGA
ncbi:MAG: shikimate dehydrogenase, partial [Solirubrobacteraceae bacterium]